jgi:hypothetical protein
VHANYKTDDERIRAASTYSKDLELEADSLGLLRLGKTGYDCNEAISSFFVLQFSELPFEDYEFNPSFLENPVMKLPKDLLLDSIRPINLENDMDDDSYSSHPNIATRRKMLTHTLGRMRDYGNQKFVSTPDEFFMVRKICRFETVRIMLNDRNYCPALYNAYILQQQDTGSIYLKTCIGKALYGMAKYKNHGTFGDISEYYGKKEGNQQQVYHIFGTLNANQLNMLALRYLYNLSRLDSSYTIVAMRNDLAFEAVSINDIHYEDMQQMHAIFVAVKKDTAAPVAKDTVKTAQIVKEKESTGFVSKYDKLRVAKKKQDEQKVTDTQKADESKYYMLAFADVETREDVKQMFASAEKTVNDNIAAEKAEREKLSKMTPYQIKLMKKNEVAGQGQALGIDTVIYTQPFYYLISRKDRLKLIESENLQLKLSETILKNAVQNGLKVNLLDPKSFTANDVDKYNDMAVVNDWLNERFDHEDDLNIIPLETDRADVVAMKYHTTHFGYTGGYTVREKKQFAIFWVVVSVIFPPVLIITIPNALIPKYNTYYYTLLYNTKTGKNELNSTIHMKSKASINGRMHNQMMQIKKHPKPIHTIVS